LTEILVPLEQEGTKAVVRRWLKKIGEAVAMNDPLVELETDKVAMEVPSPAAGVLREIVLGEDADALPGAVLGRIEAGAEVHSDVAEPQRAVRQIEAAALPHAPAQVLDGRELRLSPSVKRAIRQSGLDPLTVPGTGRDGRLTRADVDRALADGARPMQTDIPHDRMRLRIAENMLASVTAAPHVTAVFEADFGAIAAHRDTHRAAFAGRGVKLTYTAYILTAAAEAMAAVPAINGRWHPDRLELFADVNIGVGTALGDKGLVVPVVRRVQASSLEEVARRLDDLTARARGQTLTPADMRGGTFTMSNHGVSGSLIATPIIINQPQVAILGVGKLEKRVVVRSVGGADAILIRPMAFVSLTIDHRAVDGHQTNAWLTRFVEVLENWPA
jgi:2-oxoglutarate dehydrogenase E2 component (dihydrolipoamide succinyltransferase)